MTPVTEYFSGERLQCSIGIAISIVSIALALYFLFQLKTELYKGMAWPFLIIPALLLIVCIGVVWRTPHDIERVTRYVQHEPEKIATDEIPRMESVLRSFTIIKLVEICLLVIALGLVLYAVQTDNILLKGIGLGLAIQSAILYGFDYFAHNRANAYLEYLQGL